MDEGAGIEQPYYPSKSRVLDIKPLRSIAPVFPTQIPPQFFSPNFFQSQTPPPPTPPAIPKHFTNSSIPSSSLDLIPLTQPPSSKKIRKSSSSSAITDAAELAFSAILSAYDTEEIRAQNSDGDRPTVQSILSIFNSLRRKISQIEEEHALIAPGLMKRSDLKSGALLMQKKIRTNSRKRVGVVPGVGIGDVFLCRMELCLVGVHSPNMAGVDYISVKTTPPSHTNEEHDEIIAISVVSSEGYDDKETEDGAVLIYTGQGGGSNSRGGETADQKLEKGNLAMENSLRRGNEVRVIRGIKDFNTQGGKIYVYDGLYRIQGSWTEKGKSGCSIFRYRFVRILGQEQGLILWRSVQKWRSISISTTRNGLILPDLTSGLEKLPVTLVNDEDGEKGPPYFIYSPTLKYCTEREETTGGPRRSFSGCTCVGSCRPGDLACRCVRRNGGRLPYTGTGVLVEPKRVIFECGSGCSCPPGCRNRVSQAGVRLGLEVFRTREKGWGLRSRDVIRAGSFICEYSGEVISTATIDPAKSTAAIDPAKSTAAIDPAKSTAAIEPAKSTAAIDPAKSTATVDPAKSTAAIDTAKSTATVDPAKSTATIDTAKSTATVDLAKSTATVDLAKSTATVDLAKSTATVDLAKSMVVVESAKSTATIDPAKSMVVIESAKSTATIDPEKSTVVVEACSDWMVAVEVEGESGSDDEYVVDTGPVLAEEGDEEEGYGYGVVIRGKDVGNVARFMNHGCTPTVSGHIVAHGSEIHLGFYAVRNIAPLEELTFEYGAAGSRTRVHSKRECRCGSSSCRGYFFH